MSASLVSICIPTYNGEKFLASCLESAITQTYPELEIIVVDDCSKDNTCEIARKYAAKDSRVKLFSNEKNLGLVANWNKCIELAKGEWVKFLFQDDYLSPGCIEKMLASGSDDDKIIALKRKFIFENNVSRETRDYYENKVKTFENAGIKALLPVYIEPQKISSLAVANICLNFIGEPTSVMFRRDVADEIGVFNPDLIQICDLEYFLRIGTRYGIKYIPEALAYFRIHNSSTSARNLSEKAFTMRHSETVLTAHQLLFAPAFDIFRSALSARRKIRLKLYFEVHLQEYINEMRHSGSDTQQRFREICEKYPEIEKHKNGSLVLQFALRILRLRRKMS